MLILIYLMKRGIDSKFERVLQPIWAKIELSCQQPALPLLSGVQPNSGMDMISGALRGGLAMRGGILTFKQVSKPGEYQRDVASVQQRSAIKSTARKLLSGDGIDLSGCAMGRTTLAGSG